MSTSEVTRSDSNRSDNSLKPRVSFNRDVHIKRIAPTERRRSSTDLNTDDDHRSTYKRRNKKLPNGKYDYNSKEGQSPKKFYSLPRSKRHKLAGDFDASSLDRKSNKPQIFSPPVKPPRIFVSSVESLPKVPVRQRRAKEKENTKVKRSLSDATSLKSQAYGPVVDKSVQSRDGGRYLKPNHQKVNKKEEKQEERIVDKLKQYIDEVDQELYNETGVRYKPPAPKKDPPTPVLIDVDMAEKISDGKTSKFKYSLGKTLKSLGQKINRLPQTARNVKNSLKRSNKSKENGGFTSDSASASNLQSGLSVSSPAIQSISEEEVEHREFVANNSIKGGNVHRIVKQLSVDNIAHLPPMPRSVLVTPSSSLQHNNNQPFSYIKGSTGFQKRSLNSDTDEGLGGDDSLAYEKNNKTNFNKPEEESPIFPRYRQPTPVNMFGDESFNQSFEQRINKSITSVSPVNRLSSPSLATVRSDITARRDLLEMRNKRRVGDKVGSQVLTNIPKTETVLSSGPNEKMVRKIETQYQSTPEINNYKEQENTLFFNSLQRHGRRSNDQSRNNSMSYLKIPKCEDTLIESEDEGFASSNLIHNQNNRYRQNSVSTPTKEKPPVAQYTRPTPFKNNNTIYGTSTEEETVIDSCTDSKETRRYFGDTDSERNRFRSNNPSRVTTPSSLKNKSSDHQISNGNRSTGRSKHLSKKMSRPELQQSFDKMGSQQSLGSVVYLHTPAVCDIPKRDRADRSRLNTNDTSCDEDLSSNVSSQITPYVKTSSRSFSVLAPWKPNRHKGGTVDIDYSRPPNGAIKTSDGSMLSGKSKRSLTSCESRKKKDKGAEINSSKENKKKTKESKSIFRSLSIPRDKEKSWWSRK